MPKYETPAPREYTFHQQHMPTYFTHLLIHVVQGYDHVLQFLARRFLECLALLRVLEQVLLL